MMATSNAAGVILEALEGITEENHDHKLRLEGILPYTGIIPSRMKRLIILLTALRSFNRLRHRLAVGVRPPPPPRMPIATGPDRETPPLATDTFLPTDTFTLPPTIPCRPPKRWYKSSRPIRKTNQSSITPRAATA